MSRHDAGSAGEFLTRADVALMLGVSPNTVARWARQGRLPCQMTLGGHRRFERTTIDAIRRRMRGEAERDAPAQDARFAERETQTIRTK
jgi:excisionase family DNA binding protein